MVILAFLAGKTLDAKPDSVTIFCDSKLIDANLWASRSFKPRQFHWHFTKNFVLTMMSFMKRKITKIISPIYRFLPAYSKLRPIWKFLNECFKTEFFYAYCVMPELRVKLLQHTYIQWCWMHALSLLRQWNS